MRPKTFPATTYSGNSRQRLQEIREGLKQPSKSSAQGLPVGPNSDAPLAAKVLGGKDAARQQQTRATPKFGPYQKALREIRYSLLPFANESGTSAAAEVNRQMLQELVNAGCDQEMAGRALKQTGSRSIEAALEYISKMGYLDPRNEQIVRVIKQTSPDLPSKRREVQCGPGQQIVSWHVALLCTQGLEGEAAGADPGTSLGAPSPRVNGLFTFSWACEGVCLLKGRFISRIFKTRLFSHRSLRAGWQAPPWAGCHGQWRWDSPFSDPREGPEAPAPNALPHWLSPADRSDKSHKGAKGERPGKDKKQIQTSPVPVRKASRDEEKRESRIKSYSPYAFKFFMEQHVENVIKTYQQKVNRRLQLEQEMAKAGLCEAEQAQMRKILYQKESNYNRLKRAKMDKSMFVKIKTLGIGAFGEVCLACKVDTHALYAMKTLRKKDVLNRNQVAHVKAERDILAEADNEWVVKLYYSFQDKDSLYFVMDYIPGGDMMSLLIRMEVFPEHLARFYIAELTLAIESVHKMGFIHRDIKPDNILIDLDGHIKLTDFGLCTGFRWTHNSKYYQKGSHIRQDSMEPSDLWDDVSNCRCGDRLKTLEQRARKQHQRCLAHSLVGTPNYIAPEVLLRKGYTQLCDWWSVGVILFEMLVGQPPFLAPTPTETQLKVINWENTLHIPAQVKLSAEARDLITKLCCAADQRLGRNGADDLKAHPFFGAIDFSSDIRKQPAPYVPKISHPMDTSNFDPVDEESPWNDASEDSTKAWDTLTSPNNKHPEHAFYEFTFRRFFDDNGYPFRCPKPSGADASQAEDSDVENSDTGDQTEGCQPVYV
uniref:non-specific serine/threonine protein kinase n=1 Tax=Panthera tigris altaica TaxID=74533 RepID=A0A8C9KX91_PANTA